MENACQIKMSRVMRKPTFRICENKDAYQLRSDCEADLRLCFHDTGSTIPPLLITRFSIMILAFLCTCTAWDLSNLFGNHIVGFLDAAQISAADFRRIVNSLVDNFYIDHFIWCCYYGMYTIAILYICVLSFIWHIHIFF